MANLFDPLTLRGLTMRNRIGVSPMCQYSSENGMASDWHLVHLGSRAVGGAGLVMTEATAVEARGRISPQDLGLWSDAHVEPLARATRFIKQTGAAAGIQLAHAGRKASTARPWDGGAGILDENGGWEPIGPTATPFEVDYRLPVEMDAATIRQVENAFATAAERSLAAGFDLLELHFAHGYLMHEFLSPLVNDRTDEYGGGFDGRIRFAVETVRAVRGVWPESKPLAVRLSCSDWHEKGWSIEDSVALADVLRGLGVDLVDCSSGGIIPGVKIPVAPGYQVAFAEAIRRDAGVATAAVGLITNPQQANAVIQEGKADMVFLARELLRDPYWPLHAAQTLGETERAAVPVQYQRAF